MAIFTPPSRKDNHTDVAARLQDNTSKPTPSTPPSPKPQVTSSDGRVINLGLNGTRTK